jgi:hypothetical protein
MLRSTGEKREKLQTDLAALLAASQAALRRGARSCRSRSFRATCRSMSGAPTSPS